MSSTATAGLTRGAVGFGAPAPVTPCQISRPIAKAPATNRAIRNIHLLVNDMAARDGTSSVLSANDEVTVADGKTCFMVSI